VKKRLISLASVLLMCLVLTLAMASGVSADPVGMIIDPAPKTVGVNESFTVDIRTIVSEGEGVDSAGAHLDFDATYLEVVSIAPGPALGLVLQNEYDNTAGTIDYVAGVGIGSPALTDDFVLATVGLRARAATPPGGTAVTFVFTPAARQTGAYSGGDNLLDPGAVGDGSVIITGATAGVVIEPTPEEVGVGESFTVDIGVTISGAAGVNSAGAHLDFDTTYLEVVSITPGTALGNVLADKFSDTAGTIDYDAGVPMGNPAVTTDFVLATVEFHAKAATPPGGTAVTFVFAPAIRETCVYVGANNVLDPSGAINGNVIIYQAAVLEGEVSLQGRPAAPDASWVTPLTVTFLQGGLAVRTEAVTTDSEGKFTIPDVAAGTYDICVKSPRALSNLETGVVMVSGGATPVNFGTLREGDADNDDAISLADYALLYAALGSAPGDASWNDSCDFNRNGAVDLGDYALLYANYGQVGDCYAA
jgi:hypothetical protein